MAFVGGSNFLIEYLAKTIYYKIKVSSPTSRRKPQKNKEKWIDPKPTDNILIP